MRFKMQAVWLSFVVVFSNVNIGNHSAIVRIFLAGILTCPAWIDSSLLQHVVSDVLIFLFQIQDPGKTIGNGRSIVSKWILTFLFIKL